MRFFIKYLRLSLFFTNFAIPMTIYYFMLRFLVTLLMVVSCSFAMSAWDNLTTNEFDGSNRNEIHAYASIGYNIVNKTFGGPAAVYRHYFKDRWMTGGAAEYQFHKQKFGIFADGAYRLPAGRFNFYFIAKVMYNRYQFSETNEWTGNISARWEGSHFAVTIGESYIAYNMIGSTYNEPLTFTFGVEGLLMPRKNSWNIGLYFRNYDDFYYENWNINWGACFNARLCRNLTLTGQLNIRPAGSLNQQASRYETSGKIGIIYKW